MDIHLCQQKTEGFYFDSYSLAPFAANIVNVLRKNCTTIKFNDRQLQSDSSSVRGHFCVMFLYYMTHGIELRSFFNLFSRNYLHANDEIAEEFVKNLPQQNTSEKKKLFYLLVTGTKIHLSHLNVSIKKAYIIQRFVSALQSELAQ